MLEPPRFLKQKRKLTRNGIKSPIVCSILELVRTHFAAAGGEEVLPRKFGKAAEQHE